MGREIKVVKLHAQYTASDSKMNRKCCSGLSLDDAMEKSS